MSLQSRNKSCLPFNQFLPCASCAAVGSSHVYGYETVWGKLMKILMKIITEMDVDETDFINIECGVNDECI